MCMMLNHIVHKRVLDPLPMMFIRVSVYMLQGGGRITVEQRSVSLLVLLYVLIHPSSVCMFTNNAAHCIMYRVA